MCPVPDYPRLTDAVTHPLIPKITDARLDLFFWGPYASQHLLALRDRARYDSPEHIRMTYWSAPGDSKPDVAQGIAKVQAEGQELKKGFKFGPSWTNHWVRVDVTIPSELRSADVPVILEFDPSSEALMFLPDATPLHGLTGGSDTAKDGGGGMQGDRRVDHIIPAEAVKRGSYHIFIEVSCNGMFGLGTDAYRYQVPDMDRYFTLTFADLVVPNLPVRALQADFLVLTQVARSTESRTLGLAQSAMKAANDVMNAFYRPQGYKPYGHIKGSREEDGELLDQVVERCREITWEVLGRLDEQGKKATCVWDAEDRQGQVWGIGHCHIDTAWLWRYTQTQQKVARSWTTQCDLMDRWPNHQFAASSAQQYHWLEKLYPKGFDRVKQYVNQGRFHAIGGAWLEHDCMIPSGESLCRQYMYGQRYFRSRFGKYCREAWLPDTFGYASQLPQILRLAGIKYFFTQKLSWNNINVFPYSSFNWCALDGSQVLAHMTPVDSYNAQCNYPELLKAVSNNKNLGVTDQCLLLFGNGDGGGGPTPDMLEKLERLSSLSAQSPQVPTLKMGGPADFFDDLCTRTGGGTKLPTWRGELYFELHRGTYTTQASIKKGNRNMETLLRDLEYFATMASLQDSEFRYPKDELDEMWQDTLLNQFHDVLPGTTISLVVDDALAIYAKREAQAIRLIQAAQNVLTDSGNEQKNVRGLVMVDPLRLERNEVVRVDVDQEQERLVWLRTDSSGLGRVSLHSDTLILPKAYAQGDKHILENSHLRLTISAGRISSLIDLTLNRELIKPGPGATDGGLMIYEDYPLRYDAWDVEIYHLDSCTALCFEEVQAGSQGGLRASLKAKVKCGSSVAILTISLDAVDTQNPEQSFVRIDSDVDWHEQHKFLKFALPVDIHSPHATYATQFGLVERPTHRNTTLDQAKFEVCAHGFADVSEAAYGVALASRYKYGYAVEGNTMRLSMLRSPTSPDPHTDHGRHAFSFAIMPHRGPLASSDVIKRVMRFTDDVYALPSFKSSPQTWPSFAVTGDESDGVILQTIKRGEEDAYAGYDGYSVDGSGGNGQTVIIRMYEAKGGKASGLIQVRNVTVTKCEWVDILEEPLDEVCSFSTQSEGTEVHVEFRCFEIKTLKLHLA